MTIRLGKGFALRRNFMKTGCWLAISLALVMAVTLRDPVSAAVPPEDGPDQDGGRRVGMVSTEAKCLFKSSRNSSIAYSRT